jgi:hypothetical protein
MNSKDFFLWLNGYLEALESEGITECKVENIRKKMIEVKDRPNQERIIYGPNVKPTPQSNRDL